VAEQASPVRGGAKMWTSVSNISENKAYHDILAAENGVETPEICRRADRAASSGFLWQIGHRDKVSFS
jgi:translation elongation factor P/translation initiation factor 5A